MFKHKFLVLFCGSTACISRVFDALSSLLLLLFALALALPAFFRLVSLKLLAETLENFLIINTLRDVNGEHVVCFFLQAVCQRGET